jgi:hypothetical protein
MDSHRKGSKVLQDGNRGHYRMRDPFFALVYRVSFRSEDVIRFGYSRLNELLLEF